MARWATFDCYGTLIDWDGGVRSTLNRLWPEGHAERLLAAYHEAEPTIQQAQPTLSYRSVLSESLKAVAAREGLALPAEEEGAFGDSLPDWAPFPEVSAALAELRHRGWKLVPLSNTDPDLIAASIERIGVPFDDVVTAREAGSYKPAHGHWRTFFERTGASADEHVHVAASLFHDIGPCNELGLRSVWINRLGEEPGPAPTRELPDLADLPNTLEALVPRSSTASSSRRR